MRGAFDCVTHDGAVSYSAQDDDLRRCYGVSRRYAMKPSVDEAPERTGGTALGTLQRDAGGFVDGFEGEQVGEAIFAGGGGSAVVQDALGEVVGLAGELHGVLL